MSILERYPSYGESNKGSKERQGPTLGVRLIEVSVKRESTVYFAHFGPESGVGFHGTTGVYERIYRFNFK